MKLFLTLILLLCSFVVCWSAPTAKTPAGAAVQSEGWLSLSDCQKCHSGPIADIAAGGGKHATAVTCLDCHREHRPRGKDVIPSCNRCHPAKERLHFTAENCLGCHRPHRPREIEFSRAGRVAQACRTCHPNQGEELETYSSKHSLLDCKECHPVHGKFRKCLECHKPHAKGQEYKECLSCHQPHKPLKVTYESGVPSGFCSACHVKQGQVLASSRTIHGTFLCVYCHKSQHKRIPQCVTCHGEPHFDEIHTMYPRCLTCHMDPHDPLIR